MNKSFEKKNFVPEKKIVSLRKNFVSGTHRGRFQFIVILTPYGVSFHPVVVIGLGNNLLFKSVLAYCVLYLTKPVLMSLKSPGGPAKLTPR